MTPMQRFLAIGRSRLQLLEGVAHDPTDAARVVAALEALRPARVHLDLSPLEWDLLTTDPDSLAPFAARAFERVAQVGPAEPNALYQAVRAWCARSQTPHSLLLATLPEAPPGRKGLKLLDRMVRKEGFAAANARSAVERLHKHYVARIPQLVDWLGARRALAAGTLVRTYAGRQDEGAVVCAFPEGEAIADQAFLLQHPRAS